MNCQWLTNWMNHGTLALAKHAEISGPRLAWKKESQTDKILAGFFCVTGFQS